jgi:Transposase and inactivated derivatives
MKYKSHKKYTLEEKNKIVKEYLNGDTRRTELFIKYDISSESVLHRWVKQYRETGTTSDSRSKNKPNFCKCNRKKPEQMTREELIEYIKALDDIKKQVVFLKQQKKNIK